MKFATGGYPVWRSMKPKTSLHPLPDISTAILIVRGERVILDADLAATYGVTTKRLNEQ